MHLPSAKPTAEDVRDRLASAARSTQQRGDDALASIRRVVCEHPAVAIAAAASVGVALGWWTKR